MKPAIKANGFKVYNYVLVYVDDLLVVAENVDAIMEMIAVWYRLKKDPVTGKAWDEPKTYLGANIGKHYFPRDSKPRWTMSPDQYLASAVKNIDAKMRESEMQFWEPSKGLVSPLLSGYRLELGISPECTSDKTTFYQNLIGIFCRSVELG